LHINSSNFDHQDAKYIDKVGKALIRVDSQIEEYSYVSSTSASTEANNPPMQPSIDSLSAEESAQIRISSFGRMKASVAKLLQIATEFYSESDTNVKKLQAALEDATKTNEIAVYVFLINKNIPLIIITKKHLLSSLIPYSHFIPSPPSSISLHPPAPLSLL
jgi:hypothetical protein